MSSESKPVVKPPTDFSELYQQEMERRRQEQQENNNSDRTVVEEKNVGSQKEPRRLSDEEIKLWQALPDSDEDDEEEIEEEKKLDVEDVKKTCREHILRRIDILRSQEEVDMSNAAFDSLPMFDRMRIEFTHEYDWDTEGTDQLVINFIKSRIDHCPNEETVIGYQTLLEMYDSILGPDFYYLSMFEGTSQIWQHERWCLFGY